MLLNKRAMSPRRPEMPTVEQVAGTGHASQHSFGAAGLAAGRNRRQESDASGGSSISINQPPPQLRQRRPSRAMSFTARREAPLLTYDDMEGSFPRYPPAHSIQLRPED